MPAVVFVLYIINEDSDSDHYVIVFV